jgi:hypothetical protein
MTSEVLILNKRAAIIAADSAVTTSGGEHPRYSKSATKIFDLSQRGNVAAAIFGSALIDLVPWELAIKLFRSKLGDASFATVSEYVDALIDFLSGNDVLFPATLRASFVERQFDSALTEVLKQVHGIDSLIVDAAVPLPDRQARWSVAADVVRQRLNSKGVAAPLPAAALGAELADLAKWAARTQAELDKAPALAAVNATEIAELAHRIRYTTPSLLLGSTGVVVAGYGDGQIFPAYRQVDVYGHVGANLYFADSKSFEVEHESISIIQPLAQTSMIDVFVDGFGASLWSIIRKSSRDMLDNVFVELGAQGVAVPAVVADTIAEGLHKAFMTDWMRQNWKVNFNPLVEVISTLSVDEMAHLAETLLVLESLKERVTSPSESVGGPIDIAAVTKNEGLVWVRRKHFFDPALNMRYAARLKQSLTTTPQEFRP